MHFVYILKSQKTNRHYIGSTSDLSKRLQKHNQGSNRSTKSGRPWVVVHHEATSTKAEALSRERQIKSYKGGRAFKALLELT